MLRTALDFGRRPNRSCRPKTGARMRVSVVRDLMSPRQYFRHKVRMFLRVLADREKSRAGFELIEEIENGDGVDGRRAVINR